MGAVAAGIGAGAALVGGVLGGKANAKAQKKALQAAKEQAQDAIYAANPNTSTNWGGTSYTKNSDGTYKSEQTLSPQMQSLADQLAGMAGAGRSTFDSGGLAPGLSDMIAGDAYNFANTTPSRYGDTPVPREALSASQIPPELLNAFRPRDNAYKQPELGFGMSDGPAQLPQYAEQDTLAAGIVPGKTTNDQFYHMMGGNSPLYKDSKDGGGTDWARAKNAEELVGKIQGDVHPNWRKEISGIWDKAFTPQRITAPAKPAQTAQATQYDPAAYSNLIKSMAGGR